MAIASCVGRRTTDCIPTASRAQRQRESAGNTRGAVLCSFIDWFLLLLVACLLGVSLSCLVSRVRELHFFISLI